ncbi:hypothetical protein AQ505_17360 [Pedobacter sp. PACM 27299]|uniref:PAS domain-containing sensor histidine kinase n=1 Tax=Pedobacter sp. PACM 27299 TaxID=1727164 RepID=UPI000705D5B6|nr:HAMP domain-containing sensor histidine kinase [Pedobacter sp. PACM 27299]ALL07097.1 hypothetical protein AQ505_17360 [Pedobacter sp. PACM 27299]
MPYVNDSVLLSYAENQQLLNLLPIPVAVLKGELLTIGFANEAMFDFWKRDQAIPTLGLPLVIAFPMIDAVILAQLQQVFHTGESFKDQQVLMRFKSQSGELFSRFIDYTFHATISEHGLVNGILVSIQDVSDQVFSKQLLQDTSRKLEVSKYELASSKEECFMLSKIAKLGTWKLCCEHKVLSFSERGAILHGFSAGQVSLNTVLELIQEDYRDSVAQILEEFMELEKSFKIEYPIRPVNSVQTLWFRLTGWVVRDLSGGLVLFRGIVMDITSQKLELTRKSEFIGMASHELKTPLTSLTGLLQLLGRKVKVNKDDNLDQMMVLAMSQVRKMTGMVNGFVSISRLESDNFILELSDFDLQELLLEHLNEVRLSAALHTFVFNGIQPIILRADRLKIGILVANLLANAIKYTPAYKTITISCFEESGYVQVSVTDQGCGIADIDKSRIFELFSQIENSKIKNAAGFGIGLYLCAEIVSAHQGEIWMEDNEHNGCVFHFKLPTSF